MHEHTVFSDKLVRLRSILLECESVCIGYSGGVDSVFLAKYALDHLGGDRVLAVTGRSAAIPEAQWQTARDCALRFGIPHLEVATEELADPAYAANPSNRCYFCKTELWNVLTPIAATRGIKAVVDGSNADDALDYRPGFEAAREWGVRSPLMEAGLTKQEIREASRALNLPTWDQPSSPCLSSRLPYGLGVTPERLRQIETAEACLRDLGFREFRVRHHGDAARLEFAFGELRIAIDQRASIAAALRRSGFRRVLLDVEGYRSGRLNEGLQLVQIGALNP
ncbi:MAG: ATP-dependent sacrificial sulfur transferase LarE [Gemmatimonadota bacterium]